MAKPNTKTSTSRSRAAKPAAPSGEAMFDEAETPVEPVDQPAQAVPETAPHDVHQGEADAEVQDGPAQPEVEEAPEPDDEEDGEELFDEVFGDGQGTIVEEEEEAPAEPTVETAQPDPEPADSSGGPQEVRMGQVAGLLHRVPTETVEAILGEPALERVVHLRSSDTIHSLQSRMRVTDGRCAPMIFTDGFDQAPVLFSGIESYAAAKNLGLSHISVVIIDPKDAGAVQSWITQQQAKPLNPDDDLVHQVHSMIRESASPA